MSLMVSPSILLRGVSAVDTEVSETLVVEAGVHEGLSHTAWRKLYRVYADPV